MRDLDRRAPRQLSVCVSVLHGLLHCVVPALF